MLTDKVALQCLSDTRRRLTEATFSLIVINERATVYDAGKGRTVPGIETCERKPIGRATVRWDSILSLKQS
jgi:hypothetical protein